MTVDQPSSGRAFVDRRARFSKDSNSLMSCRTVTAANAAMEPPLGRAKVPKRAQSAFST